MKTQTVEVIIVIVHLLCRNVGRLDWRIKDIEVDIIEGNIEMIVVYSQDRTYIAKDADSAKDILIMLYGCKLGREAYKTVKGARVGVSYRKNGGPLVRVVSPEMATEIQRKETAVGLM